MNNIDGNVASIIGSFLVLHKENIIRKVNSTFHEALFQGTKRNTRHTKNTLNPCIHLNSSN